MSRPSFERWPKPLGLVEHTRWIRNRRARLAAWAERRLLGLVWLPLGQGLVAASRCLHCNQQGAAMIDIGHTPGEVRCQECGLVAELPEYCAAVGWPEPPIKSLAGRRMA